MTAQQLIRKLVDHEETQVRNLTEAAKVFPQEAILEREKYTHGYARMVLLGIAELLDVELAEDERPIAENVTENWQNHWSGDVI